MPNGFATASCEASLRLPRYSRSQILVMLMIFRDYWKTEAIRRRESSRADLSADTVSRPSASKRLRRRLSAGVNNGPGFYYGTDAAMRPAMGTSQASLLPVAKALSRTSVQVVQSYFRFFEASHSVGCQ